ncbi:MAG: helix-turn-helix transcriptional regulator [Rhodospirillales bacterium]
MTLELQTMSMDGEAFRHWRKRHKLSQKDAAKALGLKPRIIQYYEKGERDGKKVEIPLSVRLACYAIESGVGDFDGEESSKLKPRSKKSKD